MGSQENNINPNHQQPLLPTIGSAIAVNDFSDENEFLVELEKVVTSLHATSTTCDQLRDVLLGVNYTAPPAANSNSAASTVSNPFLCEVGVRLLLTNNVASAISARSPVSPTSSTVSPTSSSSVEIQIAKYLCHFSRLHQEHAVLATSEMQHLVLNILLPHVADAAACVWLCELIYNIIRNHSSAVQNFYSSSKTFKTLLRCGNTVASIESDMSLVFTIWAVLVSFPEATDDLAKCGRLGTWFPQLLRFRGKMTKTERKKVALSIFGMLNAFRERGSVVPGFVPLLHEWEGDLADSVYAKQIIKFHTLDEVQEIEFEEFKRKAADARKHAEKKEDVQKKSPTLRRIDVDQMKKVMLRLKERNHPLARFADVIENQISEENVAFTNDNSQLPRRRSKENECIDEFTKRDVNTGPKKPQNEAEGITLQHSDK